MALPAPIDWVCENCRRTAAAEPYEVVEVRCRHRRIAASWTGAAWRYSQPLAPKRSAPRPGRGFGSLMIERMLRGGRL